MKSNERKNICFFNMWLLNDMHIIPKKLINKCQNQTSQISKINEMDRFTFCWNTQKTIFTKRNLLVPGGNIFCKHKIESFQMEKEVSENVERKLR